jgi:magnesium chelatase accessory protein
VLWLAGPETKFNVSQRQALDWDTDGRQWPLRHLSSFIETSKLRWHVQWAQHRNPQASSILLLHGTGASTHSWRHLLPLLSENYTMIALDFPGHGFTSMPKDRDVATLFSIPGMAAGVAELLANMQIKPDMVVGHSAGAAVACMLTLNGHLRPQRLISLNGALLPLDGAAGQFFSPLAKVLTKAPFLPELFAWQAARPAVLQKLLDGTGSKLDEEGARLYKTLMSKPSHAQAALYMMAHWDLHTFWERLRSLQDPLSLIVGSQDLIVPPSVAYRVAETLAHLRTQDIISLPNLGHLAHEEQAEWVANVIGAMGQPSSTPCI